MVVAERAGGKGGQAGTWLARAWAAVALVPVGFLLAMGAGEATVSVLGGSVGGDNAWWVTAASDLVALAVFAVPCAAAVTFGWRARRGGAPHAGVPLVIGALAGLAGVVLTVVTEFGDALRD
ncbi:MAG TPA: hypothetical protein VFJ85_09565 [Acidimicrobiales bacterium]|nr:hypothetical protein [Acidimicrobiales bacterium]